MFLTTNHVIDAIAEVLRSTNQQEITDNEKRWQQAVARAIRDHHMKQSGDRYEIASTLNLAYPEPGVLNWYAVLMLTTGGLCNDFYDPTAVATLDRGFSTWNFRHLQLRALEWYGLHVDLGHGTPTRLIPEISDPTQSVFIPVEVSISSKNSYPGIQAIGQRIYHEFGGALRFPKENLAYLLSFIPGTKVSAIRWYQLIQCLMHARAIGPTDEADERNVMPFQPQAFLAQDAGEHFSSVSEVIGAINLIARMVDVPDELLLLEEVGV